MDVFVINRKGRKHIGIRGYENKLYSVCNGNWYMHDETHEGDSNEVTCKSCLKILARADENGKVQL